MDRVPLSWSLHAGEIPVCCWLLHYITSSFHFELGTWGIDGSEGKEGNLTNRGERHRDSYYTSTWFYKEL